MEMLTRNFSRDEMACPCCGACDMTSEFMTRLQTFRDLLRVPVAIASGFRCEAHNREVGGSPESMHLTGQAADPVIIPEQRHRMIELAYKLEFSGVGLGKSKFHLDTGPVRQRSWGY
ncbi:MAG: DUF882 domain-containing protein [Deltaproteobacteria bacterium]|nr:DUF882 domain-containing protein [Deltaproteobacteria bacterium]